MSSNDFWSKVRGITPLPAPTPTQQHYQVTPPVNSPPGYANMQNLAVRDYRPQETEIVGRIQNEGFIKKPPSWVQKQAHDTCPQCNGVNFAIVSGAGKDGQYGGQINIGGNGVPAQSFVFGRCFDCGYSSHFPMSDSQLANQSQVPTGPNMGSTRQVHGAKNFGEITIG